MELFGREKIINYFSENGHEVVHLPPLKEAKTSDSSLWKKSGAIVTPVEEKALSSPTSPGCRQGC